MTTIFERVVKFNKDAGTELSQTDLSPDKWMNELDMIHEEYAELQKAVTHEGNVLIEKDRVEIADALGDIIHVAMGTMAKLGINYEKVMDEICSSNESKYEDGELKKNARGKIMKGVNFRKPDLSFVKEAEVL